jgi:hypothetical protein
LNPSSWIEPVILSEAQNLRRCPQLVILSVAKNPRIAFAFASFAFAFAFAPEIGPDFSPGIHRPPENKGL